jgi:hypothetical protein
VPAKRQDFKASLAEAFQLKRLGKRTKDLKGPDSPPRYESKPVLILYDDPTGILREIDFGMSILAQ